MDEFDIIVIGGGSAGCAAASRLAAGGRYSVALIEAGGRNDNMLIKTPGLMPFIRGASNYKYDTVPQSGLNGRIGYQPRGRGLGGSSAINAMLYIRGAKWDYDNWAALGCAGWGWDDVFPVFKRCEDNERGAGEFHGSGGPLHVMDQHHANPGSHAFVDAAAKLQLPVNADFNGASLDGFGMYQVTQKGGERWSAARAYLENAPKNLHVITGALTQKLLIEEGRVVGAQIREGSGSRTIRARGAVVLSAGAFNSPQILMLSGIGPAAHVQSLGVDVVQDKPAVGSDLQDHPDFVAAFNTKSRIFIGQTLGGTWNAIKALWQHRLHRTGPMTTPYAEAGGFWRSSPDLPAPDIQYHFVPAPLEDHGREMVMAHGFSCHACVLRPYSRGTVRLASIDAACAPLIDPAFLSDDRDMASLRTGVRQMYRILSAPPLADFAPQDRHRVDLDDDAALDDMIRSRADTVYHPVGTCRMGADNDAVVDPRLKYRGLDGLYIADASIMPRLISGNTNAAAIMIGERCADFVGADLH